MEEKREYLVKGRIIENQFSRIYRLFIFLILILLSIIFEAADITISLQKYHKIFGDFDEKPKTPYSRTGIILGNFLFIIISQIENRKIVIFVSFLFNGILYFFSLTDAKWAFYTFRFLISVLKDIKDIFIPVWIDQFCRKKFKTAFIYIYLNKIARNTFKIMIIIILHSNESVSNTIILGGSIIIFDCLLLFFPNKYFSPKYSFIGYKDKEKEKEEFTKSEISEQSSYFENQEDNNIKNNEVGFLKTILNNKIYVFSILANVCYLIIYESILKYILNPEDYIIFNQQTKSFLNYDLYSNITFVSPFGTILGGICLLFIGGYEKKNSSIFLSICSIIIFFCLLIIDLPYNIFILLFGLLMFFLFSEPLFIINKCIIINCIPNKYKGSGQALSVLSLNISAMVGPPFFEYLYKLFGNSILLLIIHFFLYILATIFCLYSSFYRYRNIENENGKANRINNCKEKVLEDIEKL